MITRQNSIPAIAAAALALCLALFLAVPQPAAAKDCPVATEPDFRASIEWLEPELIDTVASAELPASRNGKRGFPGADRRKLGSTESSLRVRTNLIVSELDADRGCFALTELDVQIVAGPVKVYVASELDIDSCPYSVTLAHEDKHVEVFRDAADTLLRQLQHDMTAPSLRQSIPGKDINVAVELFRQAISVVVGDARRKVDAQAKRRNADLDTRSSYRAEQDKCPIREWRIPFD